MMAPPNPFLDPRWSARFATAAAVLARGGATCVRLGLDLTPDGWPNLAPASSNVAWFSFSDPVRGTEITAFGCALSVPPGPPSSALLASVLDRESGVLELDVDAQAPRWVGGLGFRSRPPLRASREEGSPIGPWWSGSFVSPRALVWRNRGRSGAWVHLDLAGLAEGISGFARLCTNDTAESEAACSDFEPIERQPLFTRRVEDARAAIRRGAFEKVVLARSIRAYAPPGRRFDAASTVRALRIAHPSAAVFAVGQPGGSTFVGATPELLVRSGHREIETQALAGTVGPESASGIALSGSVKDRAEQAVVVQALSEVLSPLCESLEIAPATVLALRDVHHLTSAVRGRLRHPEHVLSLVHRLHPTPAVGGQPADLAERWLMETEPLDRGLYAGPVGFVDGRGDGQFNVAIRCARLDHAVATAFVGAGIVRDSDPDSEWRETELKLQAVRAGLRTIPAEGRL